MKQLLILSGKGGTGKTTLASAFIKLANAMAYADCDVDAPNLHLLMMFASKPKRSDYYGLPKATIDPNLCIACGKCKQYCQFDAISPGEYYKVDPFFCEGCGVCEIVCPVKAISLKPAVAGELTLYAEDHKVFSTAQLKMGNGTSGKLVSEVKKQLNTSATHGELAIIDGSPGIGCPVIASLSGVDMALIVVEPSLSGFSDMKRIIKTAQMFKTKLAVCMNKYDINKEITKNIEAFCKEHGIAFVGKIPFDPTAVEAINSGKTIVDLDCPSGRTCKQIFENTLEFLFHKNDKQ